MEDQPAGLSAEELAAETAQALPDKEVVSILDLNADLDLAIDAAAPIDLGVAANANVAAPIDAAVGANILSDGSTAQALSDQGAMITQDVDADAIADAGQDSALEQGAAPEPDGTIADGSSTTDGSSGDLTTGGLTDGGTVTDAAGSAGDLANGNLLDVDVDLDGDANIAAPINGAVAANANVAAPIDAAVAANVGSTDSDAVAVSQQDVIIDQGIDGAAEATSTQQSDITQP